ncbi:MAG: SDR family NAD(P)-dependent oxidoreductase [Paludibacteraceae bacterium]|nr:SDR family NAD(P)-dependent oxidoreductase [Paludibacteraceae bacterium]
MKQYALVTGASSGIGLCYARTLARDYHYNVLLVSNQEQALQDAAASIHNEYGVETQTLCIDLAEAQAADKVYAYCKEHEIAVEVLINDAGMLIFEPLSSVSAAKLHTMLMLHVVTLTHLCRLFGNDMTAAGHGYILNMSSMTAWMAMPGIQCYNATKSYVLNFSRAYWYEMRRHGVHVLAVTPGSTDTGLLPFDAGFARLLRLAGITMSPEKLVSRVLKVLFRSWRKRSMPGAWNYIIVPIINHLPDWVVFTAMKKIPVFGTPASFIKS